jgi:hypothetical protein
MGTAELEVMLALLDRAIQWGAVVKQAHDEGRTLTGAEVDAFAQGAEESDKKLQAAIDKARAG